jgi:predicted nucleotide-binding protein
LQALKLAIEKKPDDKSTKHSKMTHFNYARDNAIASLGKIIKHQQSTLQQNPGTTM